MNFNKLFENSVYTTNFAWKQDFYLPKNTVLRKNEFDISLFWGIENSKNDPKVYSVNSLQTVQASLTNKIIEEKQAPSKNQGYWREFKNLLDHLI
jgi:hypothetical protein